MKKNIILNKTIDFSLSAIKYVEELENLKKYVIANQLLKSSTSIGANVHEAQNSESRNDFIHKFKIAAKEVEETKYWLTLCKHLSNYPDCEALNDKLFEIDKIITTVIATTKKQILNTN